jgi:hypothetical protein
VTAGGARRHDVGQFRRLCPQFAQFMTDLDGVGQLLANHSGQLLVL